MTETSIPLQELRKRIGEKAKADARHRFWGLYTHVWKLNVLGEAYRLAKKNNGAQVIDGQTFAQAEARFTREANESSSPFVRRLAELTSQWHASRGDAGAVRPGPDRMRVSCASSGAAGARPRHAA